MNRVNFKEKSYWMTTRDYEPGPSLQGDIDVDVAIIGGDLQACLQPITLKRPSRI